MKLKNSSRWIHNNDTSMLEMKGVGDNFKILVTFLAISATNNPKISSKTKLIH